MTKYRRIKVLFVVIAAGLIGAWIYWSQPRRTELATFAPADCLAFVEAENLNEVLAGVENSRAWQALAGPVGVKSNLLIGNWLTRLARWFQIGSADTLLLARSQAAIVFTGAQADKRGSTLTVRPLATLIIDTHSSPSRVRPALESRIEELARRIYGQTQISRKQIDGVDITEWASPDAARRIVMGFLDSVAIIGNDEASFMNCVETKRGKRAAITSDKSFDGFRRRETSDSSLFGFVSKSGVKSITQAYALYQTPSTDAVFAARILSDTTGNLVNALGCRSKFVEGSVEDRCYLVLAEGVAQRLRATLVAHDPMVIGSLPFVPPDAYSVSIYNLTDVDGFWNELNAVVSSHTDAVGALAARPLLRALLKPYGIEEADTFMRAIGARIETIRVEANSPSVLVTQALDRQSLRKVAEQRLGPRPSTENIGEFELLLSTTNDWGASFVDNHFLIGPAESIRRCLQAKVETQSIASTVPFRHAEGLIDNSVVLTAISFTSDRLRAISFVELFSEPDRPAFSSNASAVDQAARSLPYAINVTMLQDDGFEWTSRSAFGLLGPIVIALAPEREK